MAIPKVNLRKIKRKSGTHYMLDYAVDGKRIREMVGKNKRDAELIQAKTQHDLSLGTYNIKPVDKRNIDLDSLIEEFLNSKKNEIRASSQTRYKNYLIRLKDFMYEFFPSACQDVRLINSRYINECFDEMLSGEIKWSNNTTKSMKEKISSLFNYALKHEYIEKNPVPDTKKIVVTATKKVEYFTDAELEKIYDNIEPFWIDHLKFIVNTGLRKNEMINQKWDNVDLVVEGRNYSPLKSI